MDAPSRGHDLKPIVVILSPLNLIGDAPSRGHDLKLEMTLDPSEYPFDAPSRGHDLKQVINIIKTVGQLMPPCGGMT